MLDIIIVSAVDMVCIRQHGRWYVEIVYAVIMCVSVLLSRLFKEPGKIVP